MSHDYASSSASSLASPRPVAIASSSGNEPTTNVGIVQQVLTLSKWYGGPGTVPVGRGAVSSKTWADHCLGEGAKGAACPPVANRSTAGREAVKEASGWDSTTALTGMPVQASAQVMLQYGRVLEAEERGRCAGSSSRRNGPVRSAGAADPAAETCPH